MQQYPGQQYPGQQYPGQQYANPTTPTVQVTPLAGEQSVDTLSQRHSFIQFLLNFSLTMVDRDVQVTTRRLILYETRLFLGFLPRGTSLRAAMLFDVGAAKMDYQRLPISWLLAGIFFIAGG